MGSRKPTLEQLQYAKTLVELLLLLIAIPWIFSHFLRDPGGSVKRSGYLG